MDLSFTTENARYAFSKFDRVTIEGVAYRLHQETEVGFVFIRDDETELAQSFTHEDTAGPTRNHFSVPARRRAALTIRYHRFEAFAASKIAANVA